MRNKIFVLFILGLLLRLVLSIMANNGDMGNHLAWAKDINNFGPAGFYERTFNDRYGQADPNYPPLAMMSFAAARYLFDLIGPLIWWLNVKLSFFPSAIIWFWQEQNFLLTAFLKLPAIMADLVLAYILYRWTKKPLAAALILFNPAFFYNSSYWGQIDAVPLVFIVGAFYYLVIASDRRERGNLTPLKNGDRLLRRSAPRNDMLSVILFTLGLLSKQTIVVFLPLFALFYLHKYGIKKSVFGGLISLVVIFLSFLPFYKTGNILFYPFATFWNKIITTFGSDFLTAHAFNFWGLTTGLGHIRDGSFRLLSLLFVGGLSFIILYKLYKRKFKTNDIIWAGFLIPWTVFLFATRMHERHLLLTLPFLLLAAMKSRQTRLMLTIFIFLSVFHFLNLYHGWWSPHFWPVEILLSPAVTVNVLIAITIGLYLYLYHRYVA